MAAFTTQKRATLAATSVLFTVKFTKSKILEFVAQVLLAICFAN
jgi:hypothetical protein